MAKLSDIVGALMADLASARHYADEQTVRLAKLYREDPILKAMSIPRIRMPEITVDLPVLISGPPPPKPVSPMPAGQPVPNEQASGRVAASEGFVRAAEEVLRKLADGSAEAVADDEQGRVLPSLEVLVDADDLKSRGGVDGAFVTRLRFKLREEAVEWAQAGGSGTRGEPDLQLIPE